MFSLKGSAPSSEKAEKEIKPETEIEPTPPAYSALKTTFASMFLQEGDYIRMLQFPKKDIDALRGVIQKSWARGIQKERLLYSSIYEFKLRGNPWGSTWNTTESVPSRILMQEILAYIFSVGWIPHASNNDAFIFRQQQTMPPDCYWMSITFYGLDRLCLIGASTESISSFRDLLKSMGLLQDESWKEEERNAWEFKIKGSPWSLLGEDVAKGSLLLLRMVETLEMHGWSLYSNTRLRTQNSPMSFSNGWFCVKDKQWTPGMVAVRGSW